MWLSPIEVAWTAVWAKSERDPSGELTHWLPLHQHLADSAGVARLLVREWLSPAVVDRLAAEFPGGREDVETLTVWLASVHDLLKCSPAFACQVPELANHMASRGLTVRRGIKADPERPRANHAVAGQRVVREWLEEELGFDFLGAAHELASVVGSHHGLPPDDTALHRLDGLEYLLGDRRWQEVRDHILGWSLDHLGGPQALVHFRGVRFSRPALALLTALVIVADWIASNSELFPLYPVGALDRAPGPDDTVTERRVAEAWSKLNLSPRWRAVPFDGDVAGLLRRRFERDRPRDVQIAAVRAAVEQPGPGLLIIEAPMGSGKTEAALLVAEVMAHRAGADGVIVALPTQATTDAMFGRVHTWLHRLDGIPDRASVSLAHGKAHLNDTYSGLVRRGRFASMGDDVERRGSSRRSQDDCEDPVVAHWWLSGRKKSGLAPFVVGTIDQLLFAALKSRHVMLRHLSLAGKVVVVDEVHAYDVYMSQYLHRVLEWLGAYRVPVVLLSATLPDHRRAELLHAYDTGRGGDASCVPAGHPGYPVVSVSGGPPPTVLPLPPERTRVALDRLDDGQDTLVTYLRAKLADGGCAVVVHNTVGRVQETARRLSEEFGEDAVTIAHSRFLACDRAEIDRGLLRRFGPPESAPDRPPLHIVVASQVVEQSLDVDFDLMVTDLAPVDLLLQRMGRLHRHTRSRPTAVSSPRCAIVGVEDWAAEPARAHPGSRRVYGEHLLLRAAALMIDRDEIALPHDIAPLVQAGYGDTTLGPNSWQPAMTAAAQAAEETANRRAANAKNYRLGAPSETGALTGWLKAGVGDASEDTARGAAQVRDGAASLEVLVVERDAGGGLRTLPWVPGGGKQLPLDSKVPWDQARVVAACSLRLPLALSTPDVIDEVIDELEDNWFASFQANPLLSGQLVLTLDAERRTRLHDHILTYDRRRGLMHEPA
ncbi:CRISPR-associated helicase Cas3' [Actinoalloteichus caeruleus]|uniref:CRISPR-associated helicase Cas3' n=1 Tax=Actinoalloteichus cyanogriseus TaxID=2893586 RepID=UPI003BB8FF36